MVRFFTKVFQDLNIKQHSSFFDIIEEKVIRPRTKIAELLLKDLLSPDLPAFIAVYPDLLNRERDEIVRRYNNANICVHCFNTTDSKDTSRMSRRVKNVSEELGTVVSSLYLRSEGYIVGFGRSYGQEGNNPGVDDVIAWRSPILDELREFGFADIGCTESELENLRRLGRERPCMNNPAVKTDPELIFLEVEPSRKRGLTSSQTHGLNQVFRAQKLEMATGLYICFPLCAEDPVETRAEIDVRCDDKLRIGSILFDDQGLYICNSDNFQPKEYQLKSEIERLEKELIKSLLQANFYLEEILEFAHYFKISTRYTGTKDIENLISQIADEAHKVGHRKDILEKLSELVAFRDQQ